ncbi:chaperone protein EcpD [Pseudomonas marincola]|nr:chaperone protein EcpD [Pseudomonas marincola]
MSTQRQANCTQRKSYIAKRLSLCACVMTLLCSTMANAAFSLNRTRVIVPEGSSSSVQVTNNSELWYGLQAWLENEDGNDAGSLVVVSPQIQKVAPGGKVVLRLMTFSPPSDREQLYYLNVQELPPSDSAADKNKLSMAIRTRIKVLIRPAQIAGDRKNAEAKVTATQTREGLKLVNTTPYYFSIPQIMVNKKGIKTPETAVFAPFQTTILPQIKQKTSSIDIMYLSDFGDVRKSLILVK